MLEKMKLEDVPELVMDKLMSEFTPYSVALGVVQKVRPQVFRPLGSGTLVKKKGRFGILTAHHCLHAKEYPPVELGSDRGDILLLVMARGRSRKIRPLVLHEHQLAPYNEDTLLGPDLTFIEIDPSEALSSLQAVGSFWPLDRPASRVQNEAGKSASTTIVLTGFPQADYRTQFASDMIHHNVKHMAYIGVFGRGDVTAKNHWDYVEASFNRRDYDFPDSFQGVSGGGIWGVKLFREKSGEIKILTSGLIGVSFHESGWKNGILKMRGHFIKSIYDRAWKDVDLRV